MIVLANATHQLATDLNPEEKIVQFNFYPSKYTSHFSEGVSGRKNEHWECYITSDLFKDSASSDKVFELLSKFRLRGSIRLTMQS
jgi:hypothetical protein